MDDPFYTYERVQVGCPSKWFAKTSNTRVYLKDTANLQKVEIEGKLRGCLARGEERRDRFIMREVLRKNIWKYKPADFNMRSEDD